MKIHFLDSDPRRFTDSENYPFNHGPFSEISLQFNKCLKELGYYAEPDDADFVGKCDGLDVGFKYKNKQSFLIHVYETINTLPHILLKMSNGQRIFGLSNQITNLWHKYGRTDVKTVYGGCDTNFWYQTKDKLSQYTFLHVNSSNVRSGLDLTIEAFYKTFANKDVRLVIKDTNDSKTLIDKINYYKEKGANIEYISKRMRSYEIRDLYSSSHVCINLLRATSFGLCLLEASACNCFCLTGNISPTNEIIDSSFGILVEPSKQIELSQAQAIGSNWGLLNCYPNFSYPEVPKVWDYDVNNYADILKKIYENWANLSKIDTRTPILNNWKWIDQAKKLINYLKI
ncbi:MAG: glycosyltransferase [Nanoarchaeota archaeon]